MKIDMETVSVPYAGQNAVLGVITEWVKGEGERVLLGEVLVVIETDVAIYELRNFEGVVRKIHYYAGQSVASGMVVGLIGQEDEPLPDDSIFSSLLPAPPPPPEFVAWQQLPSFLGRPLEALVNVRPKAGIIVFGMVLGVLMMILGKDIQQHRVDGASLLLWSVLLVSITCALVKSFLQLRRKHRQERR